MLLSSAMVNKSNSCVWMSCNSLIWKKNSLELSYIYVLGSRYELQDCLDFLGNEFNWWWWKYFLLGIYFTGIFQESALCIWKYLWISITRGGLHSSEVGGSCLMKWPSKRLMKIYLFFPFVSANLEMSSDTYSLICPIFASITSLLNW